MKNKKTLFLSIGGILLVSLITIGLTYAYWVASIEGEGEVISLKIANLKVILTDTEILSNEAVEPGWSDSKKFTVENEGNTTREYNIVIKNYTNTLVTNGLEYKLVTNSLEYKITSDNGYNMSEFESVPTQTINNEGVLAYSIPIGGKETHTYTIEFRYLNSETIDQSADMGRVFSGNLSIEEGTSRVFASGSLAERLLIDNPTRKTRTDFSKVLETENTGTLYVVDGEYTEDGSMVYYYAGNAQNNWVKFGKDQDGNDLYWRIIRTNEDGSVRLLYVGTDMATTSAFPVLDGTSLAGGSDVAGMYNSLYDNTMYVGYMYGESGSLANNRTNTISSGVKTVLDSWYSKTMSVQTDGSYTYDNYVSKTAIYCNDRATSSYAATSGHMDYAAHDRLVPNKQPSYKCGVTYTGTLYETTQASEDKFSASTASGGNGQLTYPIALMTADEVAYAGGVYNTNSQAWYYYNSTAGSAVGSDWWTMSPYNYGGSYAVVFRVLGSDYPGYLSSYAVYSADPGARPTLSLKSCVTWKSGNGSSSTPYEVTLSETCSTLEN